VRFPVHCAESAEVPDILRVLMAQDVVIATIHYDAKKRGAWRVPTIFHGYDFERTPSEVQTEGALVALVPGVTVHAHHLLTHGLAPPFGCPPARRSMRRPGK
jgi:hypothetical protein